jgi:hypothetical protein
VHCGICQRVVKLMVPYPFILPCKQQDVSSALWNMSKSGNADHAISIYFALEMTESELSIVKCVGGWDTNDTIFICFALEMTE